VNTSCPLELGVRRSLAQVSAGSPGIIAVSGGADSVALWRAVLDVRAADGAPLVLAHVNHQLRGDESEADEVFVHRLHAQSVDSGVAGLLLRVQRLDTRALAMGENLESAARHLRYDWLTTLARETGATWVAIGHTADDQAETVLHRLLRGTGLRGLAGIPARRELAPGVTVLRPFLHVYRADVLAYLHSLGQEFCQDSSNVDRQFMRNRLRHELLPLLAKQFNPAIVDVLGRLGEQAAEAQQLIEEQAQRLLSEAELPRAGGVVILDARRLAEAPALLLREVLRLVWRREGWPLRDIGFDAWERAAAVVRGETLALDVPGEIHLQRFREIVQIRPPGTAALS
jgi:tRNA(Ile)-lysidine synthase